MRCKALALTLLIASATALSGCATFRAKTAHSRGDKALAKGDLAEAILAYEEAVEREPGKSEHQEALSNARRQAAESHRQTALAAEARGDHAAAVKSWSEAERVDPKNEEWRVRRELAQLLQRRADPVDYYVAVKKLAGLLPQDPTIAQALAGAKEQAVTYHLRLAGTYAEARAYSEAYREYEIAQKIAPEMEAFNSPRFQHVAAHHFEVLGDQKMEAGDSIGAYEAYDKAANVKKSSQLARKMALAKRGAGPLMEQLEQAEALARLGKWEDAAEIYSALSGKKGAPGETFKRATEARAHSAALKSDRAKAYAERGLSEKAVAELALALEHTDGNMEAVQILTHAIEDLAAERPGSSAVKFAEAEKKAPELAIVKAAPVVLRSFANEAYERARKRADRDPAEALVMLRELEPFAAQLSGYEGVRKGLTKTAFGQLLRRAEDRAASGEIAEAIPFVRTALAVSQPPADLAVFLNRGAEALEKKDFETAHNAFSDAVAKNGKSQLAKVGLEVSRVGRLAELHRTAADARDVDDQGRAASAYRAILDLDPKDARAREGLSELRGRLVESALRTAEAHASAGRTGAAWIYFYRVVELDPHHELAAARLLELREKLGGGGDEPQAYVGEALRDPGLAAACPDAEKALRDRLMLYLGKTSGIGARYLTKDEVAKVDKGERLAPPIELRPILVSCSPEAKTGAMTVRFALLMGGKPIFEGTATGRFDPTSIPKDELESGLPAQRVIAELVGGASKDISTKLKSQSDKLRGWRAAEVKSAIAKDDGERAARWYAALRNATALADEDRQALRDLERYVSIHFR